MKSLTLAAAFVPVLAAPLAAQETPYMDNRSDAASLVRSLYNAVNRKEFARAWGYFGDEKPSKDLEAFIKGYEGTERVLVETGLITEEGAAGSTFYSVPVAIKAQAVGGGEQVFAGCYVARLSNPQVQGEQFAPMHIEKGTLRPAEGALQDALPAKCGDGPAPSPADLALAKAKTAFAASYAGICQTLDPEIATDPVVPESYEIKFRYDSETETDPERSIRLFRFACGGGAYNTSEVFYTVDDYGETKPISFAVPELDIRYENNDFEGKVESLTIIGYRGQDQVVNSEYSPDSHTLVSFSKWRGIGDASSIATWLFRDGEFTLVKYEVDATYDGEIEHQTLLDFDTGP